VTNTKDDILEVQLPKHSLLHINPLKGIEVVVDGGWALPAEYERFTREGAE